MQKRTENMEWATVLISRAPDRIDELDLNSGDFIKVLQKFGDGWFKGSIRGHIGLAPMSHVKIHKHLFSVRVEHDYDSQLPDELDLKAGDILNVLDDDLEDAGWWLGEIGGKVGLFPNNFVERIRTTPMNHAVIRKKARSSIPVGPPAHLYEEHGSGDLPSNPGEASEVAAGQKLQPQPTPQPKDGPRESTTHELKEELAKIRFSFEWFSMRHAKMVSQLVDEIEDGKKQRKLLEAEVEELSKMASSSSSSRFI